MSFRFYWTRKNSYRNKIDIRELKLSMRYSTQRKDTNWTLELSSNAKEVAKSEQSGFCVAGWYVRLQTTDALQDFRPIAAEFRVDAGRQPRQRANRTAPQTETTLSFPTNKYSKISVFRVTISKQHWHPCLQCRLSSLLECFTGLSKVIRPFI